ncbi:MAG: homoserine kinase, partial [Planctomycetota bacterium]
AGAVQLTAVEAGDGLPADPQQNTAIAALLAMSGDLDLPFGLDVRLQKGIPPGSGMGSSAASAVGAVVAANELLGKPVSRDQLFDYALAGEAVASGAAHGDNVAPCLHGGLTAILPGAPRRVLELPVPGGLLCVLVRPHTQLDTRAQRSLLRADVPLPQHVEQAGHLAGFIAACYRNDLELLGRSLRDVVVGPQRARQIPGFDNARAAALAQGALGCAIAGSGPSLFAWVTSPEQADAVQTAVVNALQGQGVEADTWIGPVAADGARVVGGDGCTS